MLMALLAVSTFMIMIGPAYAWAKSPIKSDSNMKVIVEYRLVKDGILKNDNISVIVAGGKVILTGTVPTLHGRMEAAREAGKVDQGYAVVNDLTVSVPYVPNKVLAAGVLHKVEDHVFYTVFDWLTVGVKNGVVTLHGWVSEPWEVHQYEDVAAEVPGVRKIINKLKVEMTFGYLRYRAARLIYSDPLFWQYSLELNPPVHVVVNNGTVRLEGFVDSSGERGFLGDEITFRTNAVRVVNDLQVVPD